MIAADRILIRKAECAAAIDIVRGAEGRLDALRRLETRMHALADALMEARAATPGDAAEAETDDVLQDATNPAPPGQNPTRPLLSRGAPSAAAPDSGHPLPAEPDAAPAPDSAAPAAQAEPLPPPATPADATPAEAAPQQTWTAERVTLLAELYQTRKMSMADMLSRLNTLPGRPIGSAEAVRRTP